MIQLPINVGLAEDITADELDLAIKLTNSGRAPGMDGIPAEIYKNGGGTLRSRLLSLFNMCLSKGVVPQDLKDALIVTLYKKRETKATVEITVAYHSSQ